MLWLDKYKPKKIDDIIGQTEAVDIMKDWFKKYKNKEKIKCCLLLVGDNGIGKTLCAHLFLKENGYDIFEFNASDNRTKNELEQNLYEIMEFKHSKYKKPVSIIMDEIENISVGDKGGLGQLINYITPSSININIPPIICICNEYNKKKINDLYKECHLVNFTKPTETDIRKMIYRISENENMKLTDKAINIIIEYSQYDYRRLINYMQSLYNLTSDKIIDEHEVENYNKIINKKNINMDVEDSIKYILKNSININDTLKLYINHKSYYICIMYENFPNFIDEHAPDKIKIIREVLENISNADIIDKIMHKNQLWHLYKIHGIFSCYLPSKLLRCNNPIIDSTSSRSKFNQQKNNEKDLNLLSSKLKSTNGNINVQILSGLLLHYLSINKYEMIIKILINYNVNPKDLKTIFKVDRFSENIKITTKMMNEIERLYNKNIPKNKRDELVITINEKNTIDTYSNE